MVKYSTTAEKICRIKRIIKGTGQCDEYGNYSCGCSINPKHNTISGMCNMHKLMIEK